MDPIFNSLCISSYTAFARSAPSFLRFCYTLKQVLGEHHQVIPLPEVLNAAKEFVIVPQQVLDTRYDEAGILEALVTVAGSSTSWEYVRSRQISSNSLILPLRTSCVLKGGGIEKPFRVYTRQKKNTVAEEIEETRTNDVWSKVEFKEVSFKSLLCILCCKVLYETWSICSLQYNL